MSDSRGRAGSRLPTTIDITTAHEARFYDYWLGGVDNYPADRRLGDEIAAHIPGIRSMARTNRAFLGRAVHYATTELGITQFLDIGTGLPTARNVHEVAQDVDPTARIVYVDKDPLVLAHARALMASTPQGRTAFIHADLHDPESILTDPILTDTLDLGRPVAIMLVAIMMYFRDADDPHGIIARLLNAVPSGSTLTISHPTQDFDLQGATQAARACEHAGITMVPRTRAEIESLFTGTEIVEPGVVTLENWRPELAEAPIFDVEPHIGPAWAWAGVGRKP
ncbi:SAM-dependent methyltransferase [Nocardia terpenica]|uniref:Methyltransferase n=1 Tax=Nocardia terpenica TaxID=455432 RepID=A0A161Z5K2_9NOCA|nr:SAM-dependent methyltransferase [Nocardia terpenica]KZM75134.1 methyltransferase [Nocardia terpenica]NQE93737.1 SAM-dependent methyltransferase [Nocardia terpenica]